MSYNDLHSKLKEIITTNNTLPPNEEKRETDTEQQYTTQYNDTQYNTSHYNTPHHLLNNIHYLQYVKYMHSTLNESEILSLIKNEEILSLIRSNRNQANTEHGIGYKKYNIEYHSNPTTNPNTCINTTPNPSINTNPNTVYLVTYRKIPQIQLPSYFLTEKQKELFKEAFIENGKNFDKIVRYINSNNNYDTNTPTTYNTNTPTTNTPTTNTPTINTITTNTPTTNTPTTSTTLKIHQAVSFYYDNKKKLKYLMKKKVGRMTDIEIKHIIESSWSYKDKNLFNHFFTIYGKMWHLYGSSIPCKTVKDIKMYYRYYKKYGCTDYGVIESKPFRNIVCENTCEVLDDNVLDSSVPISNDISDKIKEVIKQGSRVKEGDINNRDVRDKSYDFKKAIENVCKDTYCTIKGGNKDEGVSYIEESREDGKDRESKESTLEDSNPIVYSNTDPIVHSSNNPIIYSNTNSTTNNIIYSNTNDIIYSNNITNPSTNPITNPSTNSTTNNITNPPTNYITNPSTKNHANPVISSNAKRKRVKRLPPVIKRGFTKKISKYDILSKWSINNRQLFAIYFPYFNKNWVMMSEYFLDKKAGDLRIYYRHYYKNLSVNEQKLELSLREVERDVDRETVSDLGTFVVRRRSDSMYVSTCGIIFEGRRK